MLVRTVFISAMAAVFAPAQSVTGNTQFQAGGFVNRALYQARPAAGGIVIPQVADGAGWKTTFRFVNLSSHAVTFNVLLFSDSGADMALPVNGIGSAVNLSVNLAAANSVDVESAGSGDTLTQGWAYVLPQSAGDSISGFTTFRQRVAGQPDQESTVPFVKEFGGHFAVMFDNTKFETGLAVANASATDSASIPVSIRDEQGNVIDSQSLSLAPEAHTAFALSAMWPSTAGRQGTLEFSGAAIGAMGLRFNGPAFTELPVLSNFSWSANP